MLSVNCVLIKLVLDENGIGDAGLTHLANAMRFNTTLTKLSLNQNYIYEAGVISLGMACQEQCSLRNISLLENSVTSVAARELARFVAGNTTLHSLQLSWCVNSAHEVSAFREWQLTSQVSVVWSLFSCLTFAYDTQNITQPNPQNRSTRRSACSRCPTRRCSSTSASAARKKC